MSDDELVTVRVFLAGAHSHSWRCPPDHPSISILMNALSANAHPSRHQGASPLVRLLVPEGEGRGLVFLRQSLIAVETEPALVDEMPTVHSARQAWLARQGASDASVVRPKAVVHPGFLSQEDRDRVFGWLVEHQADFLPSGVRSRPGSASDDYDFRRSRVSMELGPWRAFFTQRLGVVMPHICEALGVEVPERRRLELQLTHHGHLDGFKVHTDNSTGALRQRRISLVYYLHRHPRPFRGGELVLYDRVQTEQGAQKGEGFRTLSPDDNTLIAFPSDFHHQVRTVRLPDSDDFADGRLTVNGWLRDLDRGTADTAGR